MIETNEKLVKLFGKIETHQTVWIVDAAISHFVDAVAENETKLQRATSCPLGVIYTRNGKKDRDPEYQSIMRRLGEYGRILDFLYELKSVCSEANAKQWAQAVVASLVDRDNPPVDVKAETPKKRVEK